MRLPFSSMKSTAPERYRIVIVLCHLEGLSTEAAARQLGCPVGTVWPFLEPERRDCDLAWCGAGLALRGPRSRRDANANGGGSNLVQTSPNDHPELTGVPPGSMHWASQFALGPGSRVDEGCAAGHASCEAQGCRDDRLGRSVPS